MAAFVTSGATLGWVLLQLRSDGDEPPSAVSFGADARLADAVTTRTVGASAP